MSLSYIELHARSAFSFLEGASLPEELIGVCPHFGQPAMALLDTDGIYGAPRFHLAAQKIGLKAHIGAEVTANLFLPRSHRGTKKTNQQSTINNCDPPCLRVSVVNSAFPSSSPPAPATKASAA